jgi:hypothetical protein
MPFILIPVVEAESKIRCGGINRAYISTNNIARGMVRDRREYAFNPPKIRLHPNKVD